jgi:transmembrane sensor
MTESEFVDLLDRFEKGQSTPEEEKVLRKWFDANADATPFNKEIEKQQILASLRASVYEKAGLSSDFVAKRSPRLWTSASIIKIAASILTILAVGLGLYYGRNASEQPSLLTDTSDDYIKKVHLPDGSIVWLKPNSALTYPSAFQPAQRRVTLHGEALFEVEKNPRHPFVITCNDLTTTVLGTSFNIRSTRDHVEVIVLTGQVSLTSHATPGIVVTPEEKGLYTKDNSTLNKTKTTGEETRRVTDGTEYTMYFEDLPLQEVARRIEQKFDITINLSTPRMSTCLVTADLTDQSLLKTLEVLSSLLSVEYQIEQKKVLLTGRGCDQ